MQDLDLFQLNTDGQPESFEPNLFGMGMGLGIPATQPPGLEIREPQPEQNRGPLDLSQGPFFTPTGQPGDSDQSMQMKRNYPRSAMTIQNLDILCKNYMRGGCDFVGCKFYHPTPCELIVYSKTIQEHYLQKYGQIDICRDFLNGCCNRPQCKYKHPDAYWLGVYQRFNNGEDECGQAIKKVEQLQQPKLQFKLSNKPAAPADTKPE